MTTTRIIDVLTFILLTTVYYNHGFLRTFLLRSFNRANGMTRDPMTKADPQPAEYRTGSPATLTTTTGRFLSDPGKSLDTLTNSWFSNPVEQRRSTADWDSTGSARNMQDSFQAGQIDRPSFSIRLTCLTKSTLDSMRRRI